MNKPMVGVNVDDFRVPTKESLRRAAALDLRAVELATVAGELAPSNLSRSGRRHLSRFVEGMGLHMESLVADIPGLRLTDPRTVQERVERTCRIIELAADMKVPVVSASLGAVTHPETGEHSHNAMEALARIGEFADSRKIIYAVAPSHEGGERLVGVLDELGCDAIRVNYDPASMVMKGANPLAAIERFIEKIVVVRARDGSAGGGERGGHETPLGEGDVDWLTVLAALDAVEYRGPYILRRTDSSRPVEDILKAREVLARMR